MGTKQKSKLRKSFTTMMKSVQISLVLALVILGVSADLMSAMDAFKNQHTSGSKHPTSATPTGATGTTQSTSGPGQTVAPAVHPKSTSGPGQVVAPAIHAEPSTPDCKSGNKHCKDDKCCPPSAAGKAAHGCKKDCKGTCACPKAVAGEGWIIYILERLVAVFFVCNAAATVLVFLSRSARRM